MGDRSQVWQEVRPGSARDPEARQAAAQLSAYFELEGARASRRFLFRIVAALALAGAIFQGITRALSGVVLFVALLALGTLVLVTTIVEWRAEKRLSALSETR